MPASKGAGWYQSFNNISNKYSSINNISVQFSSVTQSCSTLCNPMNHSTPGLPVHHQLPESTQTHIYRVGDAIQPSHPLLSPPPPALNLSQHQGFSTNCIFSITIKIWIYYAILNNDFKIEKQFTQKMLGIFHLERTI